VDGGGNVVVTGYFQGTVNFGGGSLTSAGGTDIFLFKYSAAGAHVWSSASVARAMIEAQGSRYPEPATWW
jgi:hypothetical protein